jgi:hypothetical protein
MQPRLNILSLFRELGPTDTDFTIVGHGAILGRQQEPIPCFRIQVAGAPMPEQVVFPGNVGKMVMMFFDAAADYGKGEGFWLRMGLRQVSSGLVLGLLGFADMELIGPTIEEAREVVGRKMVRTGCRSRHPNLETYAKYIQTLDPSRNRSDFADFMICADQIASGRIGT